jgi:hypothetical protein
VNRDKTALSSIFDYGREHYDLPENPCRQVKAFPESQGRVRFLSDAERKALLKVCRESEWSRLYLMKNRGLQAPAEAMGSWVMRGYRKHDPRIS